MKKILFATTALVAGAAAGIASAAERPTGSVGGYMFFGAGLTDATGNGDTAVELLRDGEIHLKFSGSSDNGLTFAGRVELEASSSSASCSDINGDGIIQANECTAGDQIDENWASVSGSFGMVMVGSNDTAGDNYGDVGIFCAAGCRIAYYDGFNEVPMAGSDDGFDSLMIMYATPTIAGFTAAVSYMPDSGLDGIFDPSRAIAAPTYRAFANVWSLAANYSGEFSGFGVTVGGDYTFADATTATSPTGTGEDLNIWSLGAELGYAGFTAGIHWEQNDTNDTNDIAVGGRYVTGPWTFGAGYAFSDGGAASGNSDPGSYGRFTAIGDSNTFAGWVSYALAPGVAAHAAFQYGSMDATPRSTGVAGTTDAYNIYTILSVNF